MRTPGSRFLSLSLALAAVSASACRDSGGGDDGVTTDANDGDGSNPDDMKIQDVQNDATPVGTAVTLRRVIVVAKDTYGNRTGNFYVMEPEGGAYSGVLVFGAPLAQVDALSVGDLVDIVDAEKDEFSLETDTATITELVGAGGGDMTVTKVGTAPVPAPTVVDALANGRLPMAMRLAEQEKWEHVLIKVENVSVTRPVQQISGSMPDPTFRDFLVTGYYNVDSSLAEIPVDHVQRGDCLASVTGMGDYFFNYKILPRSTADIVPGGTGCPAPETSVADCGDMVDNDANGFADCNDNSCRVAVPACSMPTTIENIQNGMVPDGSFVQLNDVFVTGRSFNGRHIWVSDALQAAPNQGVFVFRGSSPALPMDIVVGAKVSISGQVDEFAGSDGGDSVTEVTFATVTLTTPPAAPPTPVTGLTVPALLAPATGEPYEGVLIRLANVKVTSALDPVSGQRMMSAGATPFIADDDMFRLLEPSGTCYESIVGIWHYNAFPTDNRYVFLPRSAADVDATGGVCP